MKRSEEITNLAQEIMLDISGSRTPLYVSLLKCSHLSLLLVQPRNVDIFKSMAESAELMEFEIGAFDSRMQSAADPNNSYAGPNAYYIPPSNKPERDRIHRAARGHKELLAKHRANAYGYVTNVYARWQFGNIAESIFEKKRSRVEPLLVEVLPDVEKRLNSIEQNINSDNEEDWKNAAASCRALLMDLADKLVPPATPEEKAKYINRLQSYMGPMESKTKKHAVKDLLSEVQERVRNTVDMTQGGAHKDRLLKEKAEDVVLYTYLVIAELMDIYSSKKLETQTSTEALEEVSTVPAN